MTETEYMAMFAAINEPLKELTPIFDAFCKDHSFSYVNRKALGRYPRIRINRSKHYTIWFDLWMECDPDGRRYEKFWREAPFELGAGSTVDYHQPEFRVRYGKAALCFSHKPFCALAAILREHMDLWLPKIEKWDCAFLKEHGSMMRYES